LLLPLLATLERLAPDIRMIQVAINHIEDINTFRRYNLDFAIGDFTHVPDTLMTTKLFDDHYVMVACKNHPLMQQDSINMEELIKYPLVIESQKRNLDENFILKQMKNQGYFPKVKLITPYTMLGLHALPGTQNITYIASKLAHTHLAQLGLAMRSIPYPRATYEAKLYWSSLNHDSKIHKWFRELLKQVSQELSSGF
jgi:DNA-binding transcriptional LysR family regulator